MASKIRSALALLVLVRYDGSVLKPFEIAFHHATPHGVLTAVNIPNSKDPVAREAMRQLLPEEVALANTLKGFRVGEFVGGRIALRAACGQLGTRASVLGRTERGAPILPDGLVGSVSHKGTLAIGMVARSTGGTLGVDLEEYLPERHAIASKVLTESEQAAIAELAPELRWLGILLRFSIKESIYKALDPYVHRYVGFHEAEVHPDLQGTARVELRLKNGEGPLQVDARYHWIRGRILTSVRIRPAASNEACVTQ